MVGVDPGSFVTFGALLKHLRRRARLTQQELGTAVGYSYAHIARLESGQRLPDPAAIRARFVEALDLLRAPEFAQRLIELAETARDGTVNAPASPDTRPTQSLTNLPAPLTSFIGREHDVSEIKRLLGAGRLVTLTGSGGVGKTRLALEIGASAGGVAPAAVPWPGGVWLIELAPLIDPDLVPRVTASTLGLRDQTERTPLQALIAYLEEKQILLLLDNCEHLIRACAELAEALLRACPHVRILATSREALRVPGEVTWRVPSLAAPDLTPPTSAEEALGYEAVQLFVQHARSVRPGFVLTAENSAAVSLICRRLDGIPLAIEMAAAQAAAMTPQEIAARLNDRFRLLVSGRRTALPRQQTLRAALDWSYNLLSHPEQVLLQRLAVFAGGWTAEAAEDVCADEPSLTPGVSPTLRSAEGAGVSGVSALRGEDVLMLLVSLVDKSLVVADAGPQADATRYHLLETIRQYAEEQQRECGEGEALRVRDRHLAHFLALAQETMDLGGRHVDAWVQRVDPEYNNLRAAFTWASARNDQGETALRLAAALRPYWFNRGHLDEGMAWLDAALARGSTTLSSTRARALLAQSSLLRNQGDMARAIRVGQAALALFRETDDPAGLAWCLELFANALHDSQALAEEALPLFHQLGSLDGVSRALRALGTAAFRSGDRTQAVTRLEQAIEVARSVGDRWEVPVCLARLYDVNPARALELCEQELARRRAGGDAEDIALILKALGIFLLAQGDDERARLVLEESVTWWQRAGTAASLYFISVPVVFLALGVTEHSLGHLDQAMAWLGQARALSREAGVINYTDVAQFLAASVMIAQGDPALAAGVTRECLQRFQQVSYRPGIVCALVQTADLARQRGNTQRATVLLGAAGMFGYELDVTYSWEIRVIWRWHQNAQRTVVEPALAAARAGLGDATFEAAYTAGQHMTLDQAVAAASALQGAEAEMDEPPVQ